MEVAQLFFVLTTQHFLSSMFIMEFKKTLPEESEDARLWECLACVGGGGGIFPGSQFFLVLFPGFVVGSPLLSSISGSLSYL